MEISSLDVKKLREATGASVMECKKALENAGGDIEKALGFLKEQGSKTAEKKASRSTNAGLVEPYVHRDGQLGALVEVFCETDFVARNPIFRELAHDLAMQIVVVAPEDTDGLLSSPFIKDESQTISELITSKIAVLGENIKVGRFVRFQI